MLAGLNLPELFPYQAQDSQPRLVNVDMPIAEIVQAQPSHSSEEEAKQPVENVQMTSEETKEEPANIRMSSEEVKEEPVNVQMASEEAKNEHANAQMASEESKNEPVA
jgi:hypothetical protein